MSYAIYLTILYSKRGTCGREILGYSYIYHVGLGTAVHVASTLIIATYLGML